MARCALCRLDRRRSHVLPELIYRPICRRREDEDCYQHAPASVRVDGSKPMKLMYEFLSEGVHALSEEQAVEAAMELSESLEFVVRQLHLAQRDRQQYAQRIRE